MSKNVGFLCSTLFGANATTPLKACAEHWRDRTWITFNCRIPIKNETTLSLHLLQRHIQDEGWLQSCIAIHKSEAVVPAAMTGNQLKRIVKLIVSKTLPLLVTQRGPPAGCSCFEDAGSVDNRLFIAACLCRSTWRAASSNDRLPSTDRMTARYA